MQYIGRFAPSPTGPLHFGSLVAALASYLDAKANNGLWLVRMEDLDTPRCSQAAASHILNTLEHYGLMWDQDILYQSQRTDSYAQGLSQLQTANFVYPCGCSRKEIADSGIIGIEGVVYPGTCRHGLGKDKQARAWRFNTQPIGQIGFEDGIQGKVTQDLTQQVGDFVLKRADGLFAYQLAVVMDDQAQGVTHVVRGADLLDSTPRQIALQRALHYATPHYAHVPVATNQQGEKLSKQTLAKPISQASKAHNLLKALQFLGVETRQAHQDCDTHALLPWAVAHWQLANVPPYKHQLYLDQAQA